MKLNKIVAAFVIAQAVVACGGSSSNNEAVSADISPTPKTSNVFVKNGVITGFGSVYVNGQRYVTDSAIFEINGQSGSAIDALAVGMNVTIVAKESDDDSNQEATSIYYENDIEGSINSIDRNNKIITVSGTTVVYNELTHFIGLSEALLNVSDRVEVSGYISESNQFIATYIELDNTSRGENEYTTGTIANIDTIAQTFTLNNLPVDYSGTSTSGLTNGITVKVEGTISNNVLNAIEIEVRNEAYFESLTTEDLSRIEVEGLITAYDASNNMISINGITYTLNSDTTFIGSTVFAVGDFVEAYITPTTNTISQIELENDRLQNDGKVKGVISAIDQINQTITVNGNNYAYTANTRVEDDQYINFNSLMVNDRVEIAYAINVDNTFIIQRIEREDENEFNEEWELEGLVTSFDSQTLTIVINGLTLDLSSNVRFLIEDRIVTSLEFFNALTTSSKIEADGYFDANDKFNVQKIEIENDATQDDETNDDDSDGDISDNDENAIGYVEIEGTVSAILSSQSFSLNGKEIRLDNTTELEINDRNTSVSEFMSTITIGTNVEIEGVWMDNAYIYAYEADIENNDD